MRAEEQKRIKTKRIFIIIGAIYSSMIAVALPSMVSEVEMPPVLLTWFGVIGVLLAAIGIFASVVLYRNAHIRKATKKYTLAAITVVAVFLVFCLIIGCMQEGAFSTSKGITYDYSVYGETLIVADCRETITKVDIPDRKWGLLVTEIDYDAFERCTELVEVTLPSSLEEISWNAFYGCVSLEEIDIPDSVTYIGSSAFSGCKKLNKVKLPAYVEGIEHNTFYGCISLTEITVPNYVRYIESYAFYNCESLSQVILSERLLRIDEYAFSGCKFLKEITIPESVEQIDNLAFIDCNITIIAPHEPEYYGYSPSENVTWVLSTSQNNLA